MPHASDLVPWLRQRALTVFVGAGGSVVSPSCLPSWWQLNHAVLDALARVGAPVTELAHPIAEEIKRKQDEGRMPPEYTSEVISDLLGDDYFEVLSAVEGDRTNLVHRWLAALGSAGHLPVIVTTNFDTLIERAFAEVDAPLRVLVDREDYAEVSVAAHLADRTAPCLLLKLHGTASRPSTAIDTLAQRKRGLPEAVGQVLRDLLTHTRWCVLGYSGADLDAEPNYLFLRQMAARDTPGVDWLFRDTAAAPAAVSDMLAAYGLERGQAHYGVLPGWLDGWSAALAGGAPPEPPDPIDDAAARAEGAARLEASASAWAERLGPGACALGLTSLAERLHPKVAERAGQDTLAWMAKSVPGTRHHGIALLFAGRHHRRAARHEAAADAFEEAGALFERIGAADAYADVLGDHASLLAHLGHLPEAAEAYRDSILVTESVTDDPAATLIPTIHLADVLAHQGELDEALALTEGAVERARTEGDETTRATALEHAARVLRDTGRSAAAMAYLQDAEAVRRRLGQDAGLAYNLTHQATIHTRATAFELATAALAEAAELAHRLGDLSLRATVRMTESGVASTRGDYPGAVRMLQEAGHLRQQSGDPVGALEVKANLVGMMAAKGDAHAAIEEGADALALAHELGLPGQVADLSGNLGLAYEMAGDLDAAVEHYNRCREAAVQVQNQSTEANAIGNLGNVHYRRGELEAAAREYETAIALARHVSEPAVVVRTLANLGNIRLAQSQIEAATRHYGEALSLAAEHGLEGITSHVHLNLGFVHMRQAAWADAADALQRAQQGFEAQSDPTNTGLAALYLGQCLAQLGQRDEARRQIDRALASWEGLDHDKEAEARTWRAHLTPEG